MTLRELSVRTRRLRTILTTAQPESFRWAFRFAFSAGLAFMGGLYFAHRFHEADRRIDEMRMLREVGDRLAKELDMRLKGSANSVQNFVARSVEQERHPGFNKRLVGERIVPALPGGVSSIWLGSWPEGSAQPVWIRSWSSLSSGHAVVQRWDRQVQLPDGVPVDWFNSQEKQSLFRIKMEGRGAPGWFLVPLVAADDLHGRRTQNFILARVYADFLSLTDFSKEWGARGTTRMNFEIVSAQNSNLGTFRSLNSRLSSSNDITLESSLRGDSVWLTQVEIEKNATWLIFVSVAFWGLMEGIRIAWSRSVSKRGSNSRNRAPSGQADAAGEGSLHAQFGRTTEFQTRGTRAGGDSSTPPGSASLGPRVERKEVAVLFGRLVEPESWSGQNKIAPHEVADTVFEILGGVKDALLQANLHPELRMTEEGTFTLFFEIWSEGGGGIQAPLHAILSLRRALLRINGLRKTDGHREVRVCMGLKTGVMIRDARNLPVRYIGVPFREAQDLAKASARLGVDCLIAPMGDPQRGEPLDQLAQDFILKRVAEGRFLGEAEGPGESQPVPVYVVEGMWVRSETGERTEKQQTEGLYFAPQAFGQQKAEGVARASASWLSPSFELEKDMLTRNNVIPFERKESDSAVSDSTPDTPVPKSEAS